MKREMREVRNARLGAIYFSHFSLFTFLLQNGIWHIPPVRGRTPMKQLAAVALMNAGLDLAFMITRRGYFMGVRPHTGGICQKPYMVISPVYWNFK